MSRLLLLALIAMYATPAAALSPAEQGAPMPSESTTPAPAPADASKPLPMREHTLLALRIGGPGFEVSETFRFLTFRFEAGMVLPFGLAGDIGAKIDVWESRELYGRLGYTWLPKALPAQRFGLGFTAMAGIRHGVFLPVTNAGSNSGEGFTVTSTGPQGMLALELVRGVPTFGLRFVVDVGHRTLLDYTGRSSVAGATRPSDFTAQIGVVFAFGGFVGRR